MLGPVAYAVWFVSFALEVYILVRAISSKAFLRYLTLNLFVAAMALKEALDFTTLYRYGFASPQYRYTFYYTDALLTVLMYLAIMHLYHQVFREMNLGKYIRGATIALLAGTAIFAWGVVQSNTDHLTSRFVVEMSQDLYFVGVVLTYLLWAAVFKLRETRMRLVQLVLALGIYFSGSAALYAFGNMFPDLHAVANLLLPIVGTFLPAAWAYTFTAVPESARLAPTRLAEEAVSHR
ncbi:MAG TPA: hypothetical protein VNJ52_02185 [Patescibacteria group bacterium]|nr:hypothetical protein [Patescibacteria group bacterium]